jgi:hypothetical protein
MPSPVADEDVASEAVATLQPMPYKLTWEPAGVYREYVGDISIAERRRSFDAICGDKRFDDLRYAITDYLAVGRYEVSDEATAEIAALHIAPLATNPNIVLAAVVTRGDIVAAISDFVAHGFTTAPYRTFDSVDAARRWIADVTR